MSILPFRHLIPTSTASILTIGTPTGSTLTTSTLARSVLATGIVLAGAMLGGSMISGAARADNVPADLHICNADEITTIPELQSDDANNCINDQSSANAGDDQTPKALMCAPTGKAYCCTQKVDQLGQCKPVAGGRKRTVPLREPGTTPMGEPGGALPGMDSNGNPLPQ